MDTNLIIYYILFLIKWHQSLTSGLCSIGCSVQSKTAILAYAPNTTFINELMTHVGVKIKNNGADLGIVVQTKLKWLHHAHAYVLIIDLSSTQRYMDLKVNKRLKHWPHYCNKIPVDTLDLQVLSRGPWFSWTIQAWTQIWSIRLDYWHGNSSLGSNFRILKLLGLENVVFCSS